MKLADNPSRHKSLCSEFGQSGLFILEFLALIAEKTIFDLLGMLDSGERALPFGRLLVYMYWSQTSKQTHRNKNLF